jgi:hypothetical protein
VSFPAEINRLTDATPMPMYSDACCTPNQRCGKAPLGLASNGMGPASASSALRMVHPPPGSPGINRVQFVPDHRHGVTREESEGACSCHWVDVWPGTEHMQNSMEWLSEFVCDYTGRN